LRSEKSALDFWKTWATNGVFGTKSLAEREESIARLKEQSTSLEEQTTAAVKERFNLEKDQGDKTAQLRQQRKTESIANDTAQVEAHRLAAQAQLDNDMAVWRAELSARIITDKEMVGLEAQTEEQRYQIDLQALQDKLALLEKDPTKNRAAIITLNGQIEQLEKQHQTKLLDNETEFVQKKRAIALSSASLGKRPGELDAGPASQSLARSPNDQQLLAAVDMLAKLGDETSQMAKRAGEAQAAYDQLVQVIEKGSKPAIESQELLNDSVKDFGHVIQGMTTGELLGLEEMLKDEIAATKSWGGSTADLEKKLAALQDRLGPKFQHALNGNIKIIQGLISHTMTMGQAMKSFGSIAAEALGTAVSAAVSGSESFGQAMQRMLKSTLAALAGEAIVQAIMEAAQGYAAMARYDYKSAHDHFRAAAIFGTVGVAAAVVGSAIPNVDNTSGASKDSAGSGSVDSPAAASSPNPVQVHNVQHFGTGALITRRTMAVIGDAVNSASGHATEGILPLEDPRAMRAIAGAIAEFMPNVASVVDNSVHVKVDGVVGADSTRKLAKQITTEVKRGRVRLHASNSDRVTKKV
jgi:hypothetical protein